MANGVNQEKNMTVRQILSENRAKQNNRFSFERIVPVVLFLLASVSVLTTLGILITLLKETWIFFQRVPFFDFIAGTEWYPFGSDDPKFGVLPLVSGTLLVTVLALSVALPIGLAIAIYLSEYASDRNRRILKPVLEILAGVPTIVYGFFALTFVTPVAQSILATMGIELQTFNALSPGIVMGIMIVPMIASLSEDAMSAVPNSLREGALALGATRLEVTVKVILPAALSGIIASIVLAISRAIGETMIVAIAAGSSPTLTFNPIDSIQTMTSFIVQVSLGDAGYATTIYYSMYAVGMTLFVFTLVMNMLAQWISQKFREVY
ncbi:MAG: phosphate ABC transporter permease subunit PstC [Bacilli bacterium]